MQIRHILSILGAIIALILASAASAQPAADQGGVLFEQLCVSCHSVGGGDRVGPDLAGVTQRRDEAWLKRMVREPDALVAEGDPVVTALIARYNGVIMPRLGLDEAQASALITHLQALDAGAPGAAPAAVVYETPELMRPQARIWTAFLAASAAVALVFAAVAFSTRNSREVSTERAYALRRVLFVVSLIVAIGVLAATLTEAPYAAQGDEPASRPDRIVYVAARQFQFVWSDEPITRAEDIGRVPQIQQLVVDKGSTVEFRVTSLDVTHGFGLYGPQRQIVAQTQAMPGYLNRLRVRLDAPGDYPVLCLEYCAAGHHHMRSRLSVR